MPLLRFCLLCLCTLAGPLHAADLLQAYRSALQYDAQFAAAQAQYQAAMEQVSGRRAGLLPQLSLEAQNSWNQTRYEAAGGEVESRQQNRTYSLQLAQPLLRWQNWLHYRQGGELGLLAASRLASARQALLLRVAEAYFSALHAEDVRQAVWRQKVADAEVLTRARKNFELGNVSIADVHEAQASLDRVTAQLIEAENDLQLAGHALARITGRQPGRLCGVREGVMLQRPQPETMEAWIEAARRGNLATQEQALLLEVARYEVGSRKAEHLPTLDLVASQSMQERPNSATDRSESASLGLRLSMPLYAGGRTSAAVREAQALFMQAEAELDDAKRAAELDARQAWLGVVGGLERVGALEAATLSADSALAANRLGYRVGMRTSIDVLEVQSQYSETVQQLSRARYDTLLAQLRLKAAVGSLDERDLQMLNDLLESLEEPSRS